MDEGMNSLNKVSARLSEESFLKNKGLSNEVGIHVFCYDPKYELTVRAYFETLKINDAMNGVLFIDEAYGLTSSNTASGGVASYGDEAIAVLLKEMEDKRGQFCVILAGYKDEMKSMISSNPGLESRIQFTLDFPDYTREELSEIAVAFLKKKYEIDNAALARLLDITEYYRVRKNFANARTVRNILDQVIMNQNLRTEDSVGDSMITAEDVDDYIADEGINLSSAGKNRIGFS